MSVLSSFDVSGSLLSLSDLFGCQPAVAFALARALLSVEPSHEGGSSKCPKSHDFGM